MVAEIRGTIHLDITSRKMKKKRRQGEDQERQREGIRKESRCLKSAERKGQINRYEGLEPVDIGIMGGYLNSVALVSGVIDDTLNSKPLR